MERKRKEEQKDLREKRGVEEKKNTVQESHQYDHGNHQKSFISLARRGREGRETTGEDSRQDECAKVQRRVPKRD